MQLRSNRLEIVRLNGSSSLVRIPANDELSWGRVAPDGSYTVATDGYTLTAVDSKGKVLWTVQNTSVSGTPSVNPDGTKIAFAGPDRRLTVYSIPMNRVEVFDAIVNNPEWAPTGDRIAYDDGTNVHVFDTLSGRKSKAGQGTEPSWLPAGDEIAVRVNSGAIEIVKLEGSDRRPFDASSNEISMPRWSSDGRFLYYVRTGGRHWWSIDWSGSEPRQIVVRTLATGAENAVGEVYKANPGHFTWTVSENLCGLR